MKGIFTEHEVKPSEIRMGDLLHCGPCNVKRVKEAWHVPDGDTYIQFEDLYWPVVVPSFSIVTVDR